MIFSVITLAINPFLPHADAFAIACIPAWMATVWFLMPICDPPRGLRGLTMPIYLIHPLILLFWGYCAKLLGMGDSLRLWLALPVAIGVSIVFARVVQPFKFVNQYLFGMRGSK